MKPTSWSPLTHPNLAVQLAAAMAINLFASLLASWLTGARWSAIAPFLVLNVLGFAALAGLTRRQVWRTHQKWKPLIRIEHESASRPAKGLIAMVSAGGGRETALAAARHHGKHLRHVWLIGTPTSSDDREYVVQQIGKEMPWVTCEECNQLTDSHTAEEAKKVVEATRYRALRTEGIDDSDLVCDFTGLSKHASVGMVLACGSREARLQYVPTLTTDERMRGETPGVPIEVEVAYEVVPQPE